jgi:phosphoribosyl 1,2-cyclic phosphate phosphodiesterase
MPDASLTFLGSGTSTGVPMLACRCKTCTSTDPRDSRWRASIHLACEATSVVVDTTPEFRLQCLREGIDHLDAVFLTHEHTDHVVGLDDVRAFNFSSGRSLPLYCGAQTAQDVRKRFEYIWAGDYPGGGLPRIELKRWDDPVQVGGLRIEPLTVFHGELPIRGLRVGSLAYLTDVSHIPEETMQRLQGLQVLVLGAVRHQPHPTHFCIPEALEVIDALGPERAILTHLNHDVLHGRDQQALPENVVLAQDRMRVSFSA